ncbi:hypothetical protein TNCV_182701 [Trichonephila clavipes]|nr:hypothetical protein TNCV_182701 [Trichonephila clavipes]
MSRWEESFLRKLRHPAEAHPNCGHHPFVPEEADRNNHTDPTQRSKEGQAAGIPETEGVNNSIVGEEWRSEQHQI